MMDGYRGGITKVVSVVRQSHSQPASGEDNKVGAKELRPKLLDMGVCLVLNVGISIKDETRVFGLIKMTEGGTRAVATIEAGESRWHDNSASSRK
jgi:hypothetical protein